MTRQRSIEDEPRPLRPDPKVELEGGRQMTADERRLRNDLEEWWGSYRLDQPPHLAIQHMAVYLVEKGWTCLR